MSARWFPLDVVEGQEVQGWAVRRLQDNMKDKDEIVNSEGDDGVRWTWSLKQDSATTAALNSSFEYRAKEVEMRGIEPRAFHMQSKRSTT